MERRSQLDGDASRINVYIVQFSQARAASVKAILSATWKSRQIDRWQWKQLTLWSVYFIEFRLLIADFSWMFFPGQLDYVPSACAKTHYLPICHIADKNCINCDNSFWPYKPPPTLKNTFHHVKHKYSALHPAEVQQQQMKIKAPANWNYLRLKNRTENTIPSPSPVPAEKGKKKSQFNSCTWITDP